MTIHSSILAWEIPWTEEPGGYSPWGHKRAGQDLATKQQQAHFSGCSIILGAESEWVSYLTSPSPSVSKFKFSPESVNLLF